MNTPSRLSCTHEKREYDFNHWTGSSPHDVNVKSDIQLGHVTFIGRVAGIPRAEPQLGHITAFAICERLATASLLGS